MLHDIHSNEQRTAARAWCAFLAVLAIGVAIKIVYLLTAESTADFEEIPLRALSLLTNGHEPSNIGDTRLYTINYITTAIAMWLFGIKVWAFKMPGLFFFVISCICLFLVSRKIFHDKSWYYQVLSTALIAVGPPVAQMWALKNRGGFIETWCFLAVSLLLYELWRRRGFPSHILISTGVVLGVAIWAQPLAVLYAIPICAAVLFVSIEQYGFAFWRPLAWFTGAIVLGMMPLIALNFLFHMNTFGYLQGGETSVAVNSMTFPDRAIVILDQGFPRLLGLKQQWVQGWVLAKPLSIFIYIVLLLPVAWASLTTVRDFVDTKRANVQIICVAVIALVLIGNLFTSWGGFQGEPRRLLLLYVPSTILITVALAGRPRWLLIYLVCWFGVSAVSNAEYIRINYNGFTFADYQTYPQVTKTLESFGIKGIFSPVWIGSKIQFESRDEIVNFGDFFVQGSTGFASLGDFEEDNAAVFPLIKPGEVQIKQAFDQDLDALGIRCKSMVVERIAIVLSCSRRFNIAKLQRAAGQVREFSAHGLIFKNGGYLNGSFSTLYEKENTFTWTRPDASIPFFIKNPMKNGRLVLRLARARRISSADLFVSVDNKLIQMNDIILENGLYVARAAEAESLNAGSHVLKIQADAFQPALSGSSDPRALGVPLVEVRFEPSKSGF